MLKEILYDLLWFEYRDTEAEDTHGAEKSQKTHVTIAKNQELPRN